MIGSVKQLGLEEYNTVNMSSRDENGNPYFCIPLLRTDLDKQVHEILELAKNLEKPFREVAKTWLYFPKHRLCNNKW